MDVVVDVEVLVMVDVFDTSSSSVDTAMAIKAANTRGTVEIAVVVTVKPLCIPALLTLLLGKSDPAAKEKEEKRDKESNAISFIS